jgi:hypothetical protein
MVGETIHGLPMDHLLLGKRRRQAVVTVLDEDGYLLQLCRRMEWKEVEKLLSFMLHLLRQHDGDLSSESRATTSTMTSSFLSSKREKRTSDGPMQGTSERCEIVQNVRRQLLSHDSNGNNCLHLSVITNHHPAESSPCCFKWLEQPMVLPCRRHEMTMLQQHSWWYVVLGLVDPLFMCYSAMVRCPWKQLWPVIDTATHPLLD